LLSKKRRSTVKRAFLTLIVLALLALVIQSIVFSGASFTSASSNPGNVFTAGSLSHDNNKNGQLVLNAIALRPGLSQNSSLIITGGGTVSGVYTLSKSTLVDTPAASGFSTALTLRLEDVTGTTTTLYNGTVAAFTQVSLGTITPGQVRTYRFTLTFSAANATSAMQGATSRLNLDVTGASS
jgi:hypothetical protein